MADARRGNGVGRKDYEALRTPYTEYRSKVKSIALAQYLLLLCGIPQSDHGK